VKRVRNCWWSGNEPTLPYLTFGELSDYFVSEDGLQYQNFGNCLKISDMISIVSTNYGNNRRKISLNTKIVLFEHFLADMRQAPKARFVTEE
jgi:hypothetical protein